MCGRYTLSLNIDAIVDEMDLLLPDFDFEPRFNIAPSQRLPIVLNQHPKELRLHKWGLIPPWAKDPRIGHKLINARGETLFEKPSFRAAVRAHRCLVPADGFYEWQRSPTGKVPHHIRLKSRRLMTFAGLWEVWTDPEGREIPTFTVVTTRPNQLMSPIHDRMPVIVPPAQRAQWLDPALAESEISGLLLPLEDGLLEAVPVSSRVNSPRNEGPSLLGPKDTLF